MIATPSRTTGHIVRVLLLVALLGTVPLIAQRPAEWIDLESMPGQEYHAMAYDAARERIVLFGNGGTWEWNGRAWAEKHPRVSPSARQFAGMAYDPIRRRTVLFGGWQGDLWTGGANLALGDTWEWDGEDWTERVSPTPGPSARARPAFAFDPVAGRILMYGGHPQVPFWTGGFNDTWSWDGVSWTELHPNPAPAVSWASQMATDTSRNRIVLVSNGDANRSTETWEWNGASWSQRQSLTSNAFHYGLPGMTYDPIRGRTVLHLGREEHWVGIPAQTWEWDGSSWSQMATSGFPRVYSGFAMAFDEARAQLALVGGRLNVVSSPPLEPIEMWTTNGSQWSLFHLGTGSSGRGTAAYDTSRARLVAFDNYDVAYSGGCGGTCGNHEPRTREWDGQRWSVLDPPTQPTWRVDHAVAFDALRGRTVLFGGVGAPTSLGSGLKQDTWEWDGTTWHHRANSGPPARMGHAMAYDAARGRSVLFGGVVFFPPWIEADTTWEWDGTTWNQASPATSPPARSGHAMAYDVARGRVLMFGGTSQYQPLSDTWEWDGVQWTRVGGRLMPSGGSPAMAWDPSRQEVTLYIQDQLYAFNGGDWFTVPTARPLPRLSGGSLAYDRVRGALLATDGHTTRLIGEVRAPAVAYLGDGCASSGGSSKLSTSQPSLGNRGFDLTVDGALPSSMTLFALSVSSSILNIAPNCHWYLGLDVAGYVAMTNAFGHADQPLDVPFDPGLRGGTIYAQAIIAAGSGSLSISNGLALRLGD